MTKEEANKIIDDVFQRATGKTSIEHIELWTDYHPQLGKLFRSYLDGIISAHQFLNEVEKFLIIKDTKLGKALE